MALVNRRSVVRTVRFSSTGATSAAANNIFTVALATTLTGLSIQGFANAFAADASDAQSRSASFAVDAVNKAGTLTVAGTITGASNAAVSAGTLTFTATPTASGTTMTFQITPTTSLTATTLNLTVIAWLVNTNAVNPVIV